MTQMPMTTQEFARRLAELDQQKAADRTTMNANYDQGLARLFIEAKESGRSQEWVASQVGKKQQWVSRRLIFGRFLDFTPTGVKVKPDLLGALTERRFRDHWRTTEGTEEQRFAKVAEKVAADFPRGTRAIVERPGIEREVAEALNDGEWHVPQEVHATVSAKFVGVEPEQVLRCLHRFRERGKVEAKRIGRVCQYRAIQKVKKTEPTAVDVALDALEPHIAEIEKLAKFDPADFLAQRSLLQMVAVKLRRAINALRESVTV